MKVGLFMLMGVVGVVDYLMVRWEKKEKRKVWLGGEWMMGMGILLLRGVFRNIGSGRGRAAGGFLGGNEVEDGEIVWMRIRRNGAGKKRLEVGL